MPQRRQRRRLRATAPTTASPQGLAFFRERHRCGQCP